MVQFSRTVSIFLFKGYYSDKVVGKPPLTHRSLVERFPRDSHTGYTAALRGKPERCILFSSIKSMAIADLREILAGAPVSLVGKLTERRTNLVIYLF